jgi:hypothetical protein
LGRAASGVPDASFGGAAVADNATKADIITKLIFFIEFEWLVKNIEN